MHRKGIRLFALLFARRIFSMRVHHVAFFPLRYCQRGRNVVFSSSFDQRSEETSETALYQAFYTVFGIVSTKGD
jgi:hypothetical protein